MKVLVIDKDAGQGAMGGDHIVANYPGFPEPAKASELLGRMRKQAVGLGAEFVQDKVVYTDFRSELKIVASPTRQYRASIVIIATGSMSREPSLEGEAEFAGRGVAYCAVCDGAYFEGKEVAVTGQVDRVIEELELIGRYATKTHFISPSGIITETDLKRLSIFENLETHNGRRIVRINGGSGVESLSLDGPSGPEGLSVDGIFVYLQGSRPGVEFIVDEMEKGDNGCIKVDDRQMTSIPGIFAVGDVTCRGLRQISLAVGEGCRAALSADAYIKGVNTSGSQWGT
jgi:thioredoxin reductase (NADPH)